ncbi:hypothetical protein TNCV_4793281 [Trichonephila clavipes]|nr:hypothetical protein TNCV_4793281 [Trichonephila clavipes]
MLDRSNEMLDRSNEMLDRSNEMLDRSNEMMDRSNEMMDRSNKMGVSRKSVGFHHGALGYILMHLIVQVVRQGVVIPEMGQHFQVDCKKSQLLKNFPLVRSLDDDETSLGQVTKLTPDAERQVGHRCGQVAFQVEPFIDVLVGTTGGREQVRVVHREANNVWFFAILRNVGNSMVAHHGETRGRKRLGEACCFIVRRASEPLILCWVT